MKEAEFIVLPTVVSDAWRTWLMTGARRPPFDRRRVGGAHRGLKKMLIEGTASPPDRTQPWNDFSGAMVRQAVDEAMNMLPPGHKQAVKLAYFGGFTNAEIAQRLGVGERVVRRWLREALAVISAHVERGDVLGRGVLYSVLVWIAGGRILDLVRRSPVPVTDHLAQAAVVLIAGVATATVLVGHAPSPAQLTQVDHGSVTVSAPGGALGNSVPGSAVEPLNGSVPAGLPLLPALPSPTPISVKVPAPVQLPVLPTPPPKLPSPPST